MYPHRIRLRGPWELTSGDTPPVRVTLPAVWESIRSENQVNGLHLCRRFGSPRELDVYESVWLIVVNQTVIGEWKLNGEQLPANVKPVPHLEIDITRQLRQRNRLELRAERGEPGRPVWDEVGIEIRGEFFLRGVTLTDGNRVSGLAVGPERSGLELYVLRDGQSVLYERITASLDGRPFSFALPVAPCNRHHPEWRVELVEGANRWFVMDVEPPAAAVR